MWFLTVTSSLNVSSFSILDSTQLGKFGVNFLAAGHMHIGSSLAILPHDRSVPFPGLFLYPRVMVGAAGQPGDAGTILSMRVDDHAEVETISALKATYQSPFGMNSGQALASVGDVDGNGFSDFLWGFPGDGGSAEDTGSFVGFTLDITRNAFDYFRFLLVPPYDQINLDQGDGFGAALIAFPHSGGGVQRLRFGVGAPSKGASGHLFIMQTDYAHMPVTQSALSIEAVEHISQGETMVRGGVMFGSELAAGLVAGLWNGDSIPDVVMLQALTNSFIFMFSTANGGLCCSRNVSLASLPFFASVTFELLQGAARLSDLDADGMDELLFTANIHGTPGAEGRMFMLRLMHPQELSVSSISAGTPLESYLDFLVAGSRFAVALSPSFSASGVGPHRDVLALSLEGDFSPYALQVLHFQQNGSLNETQSFHFIPGISLLDLASNPVVPTGSLALLLSATGTTTFAVGCSSSAGRDVVVLLSISGVVPQQPAVLVPVETIEPSARMFTFSPQIGNDDEWGSALGSGDVDGDGLPELLIGAPARNATGSAWALSFFSYSTGVVRDVLSLEGWAPPIASSPAAHLATKHSCYGASVAVLRRPWTAQGSILIGAPCETSAAAAGAVLVRTGGSPLPPPQAQVVSVGILAPGHGGMSDDVGGSARLGASVGIAQGFGTAAEHVLVASLPGQDLGGASGEQGTLGFVFLLADGSAERANFLSTSLLLASLPSRALQPLSNSTMAVVSLGPLERSGPHVLVCGLPHYADSSTPADITGALMIVKVVGPNATVQLHDSFARESSYPGQSLFLGSALASVADMDGDGVPDIASGAPGFASGHGGVFLHFMSADGSVSRENDVLDCSLPNACMQGTPAVLAGGSSLAHLGPSPYDVGQRLAVGMPGRAEGLQGVQSRIVLIDIGPASTILHRIFISPESIVGPQMRPGSVFAAALAAAGDVNLDGAPDLVVGAPAVSEAAPEQCGAVWILTLPHHGGIVNGSRLGVAEEGVLAPRVNCSAGFGSSIAVLPDVQGTGRLSLVVGMPSFSSPGGGLDGPTGALALVHTTLPAGRAPAPVITSAKSPSPSTDSILSSDANLLTSTYFGAAVGWLDDLDGNGWPEALVGAPGYLNGGMFVLYMGPGSSILHKRSAVLGEGPLNFGQDAQGPSTRFGRDLAVVPDANGDGWRDVVAGLSGARSSRGTAVLLYLSAPHSEHVFSNWTFLGDDAEGHVSPSTVRSLGVTVSHAGVLESGSPPALLVAAQLSGNTTSSGVAFIIRVPELGQPRILSTLGVGLGGIGTPAGSDGSSFGCWHSAAYVGISGHPAGKSRVALACQGSSSSGSAGTQEVLLVVDVARDGSPVDYAFIKSSEAENSGPFQPGSLLDVGAFLSGFGDASGDGTSDLLVGFSENGLHGFRDGFAVLHLGHRGGLKQVQRLDSAVEPMLVSQSPSAFAGASVLASSMAATSGPHGVALIFGAGARRRFSQSGSYVGRITFAHLDQPWRPSGDLSPPTGSTVHATSQLTPMPSEERGASFGSALSLAGDVDGNGVLDVVIVGEHASGSPGVSGLWLMFLDSSSGEQAVDSRFITSDAGGFVGQLVLPTGAFADSSQVIAHMPSLAGGDAVSVVAVTATAHAGQSCPACAGTWLLHLNASGTVIHQHSLNNAQGAFKGLPANTYPTSALAVAGDVDCDGVEELVLTLRSHSPLLGGASSQTIDGAGGAWVVFIEPPGVLRLARPLHAHGGLLHPHLLPHGAFGTAVTSLGILDHAQETAVVVSDDRPASGALPNSTLPVLTVLGLSQAGGVSWLHELHSTSMPPGRQWPPGSRFGASLSSVGHLIGAGEPTLLVGAPRQPGWAGGSSSPGVAWLLTLTADASTAVDVQRIGHGVSRLLISSEPDGLNFGAALAMGSLAPAANGSGNATLLVSSPTAPSGLQQNSSGAAYLFSTSLRLNSTLAPTCLSLPGIRTDFAASPLRHDPLQGLSHADLGFPLSSSLGTSVAALNESDGGGVVVLLVGAPAFGSASCAGCGGVLILRMQGLNEVGPRQVLDASSMGSFSNLAPAASFGRSVSIWADDSTGTLFAAVGAPGSTSASPPWRILLFSAPGGTFSLIDEVNSTDSLGLGWGPGARGGWSLASLTVGTRHAVLAGATGALSTGHIVGSAGLVFLGTHGTFTGARRITDGLGLPAHAQAGFAVTRLPDLDGNGQDEAVVAAPGHLPSGSIHVIFLLPSGHISHIVGVDGQQVGNSAENLFGSALLGLGPGVDGGVNLLVGSHANISGVGADSAILLSWNSNGTVRRFERLEAPRGRRLQASSTGLGSSFAVQDLTWGTGGVPEYTLVGGGFGQPTSGLQRFVLRRGAALPSPSRTPTPTAPPTPSPTPSATRTPSPLPSSPPAGPDPSPSPAAVAPDVCRGLWWATCEEDAGVAEQVRVQALPGVWCEGCTGPAEFLQRYSEQPSSLLLCPRAGACEARLGTDAASRCAAGHTGAACAACQQGYAPDQGSDCAPCVPCAGAGLGIVLLACVPALLLLGVGFLTFKALQNRGTLQQDLLMGALRVALNYVALLGYAAIALQPMTADGLGLHQRAVSLPQWQGACGRQESSHRRAVHQLLNGTVGSMAANASAWVSDAALWTGDDDGSSGGAASDISAFFSGLAASTGALPLSSIGGLQCILGHRSFAQQLQLFAWFAFVALTAAAALQLVFHLVPDLCSGRSAGTKSQAPMKAVPGRSHVKGSRASDHTAPKQGLTANPLLAASKAPSTPASPPTAGQAGKPDAATAHSTGVQLAWGAGRYMWSLYLLVWGATVAASLQLLSPPLQLPSGAVFSLPSSLGVDPSKQGLIPLALFSVILHAAVFPVALLALLRVRGAALLDAGNHSSVTLSVFTDGYRLQLTPSQAEAVTRKALGKARASASQEERKVHAAAVALSVHMSRKLAGRCFGLARLVPSHGFALVRSMQSAIILCGMWLATEVAARISVLAVAVCAGVALTYSLQPYTLSELNSLDIQAGLVVFLHVVLLAAVPGDGGVSIFLLVLHCLTALPIAWAVLRGASSRARRIAGDLVRRLRAVLPALPPSGTDPEGVEASRLPGLLHVLQACAVRCGFRKCQPTQRSASSAALSGAGQWAALPTLLQRQLQSAAHSGSGAASSPPSAASLQRRLTSQAAQLMGLHSSAARVERQCSRLQCCCAAKLGAQPDTVLVAALASATAGRGATRQGSALDPAGSARQLLGVLPMASHSRSAFGRRGAAGRTSTLLSQSLKEEARADRGSSRDDLFAPTRSRSLSSMKRSGSNASVSTKQSGLSTAASARERATKRS